MVSVLIYILVLILVFGAIGWLIQSVLPLPPPFKTAAIVVLTIIFILLLLGAIGVIPMGYPRFG